MMHFCLSSSKSLTGSVVASAPLRLSAPRHTSLKVQALFSKQKSVRIRRYAAPRSTQLYFRDQGYFLQSQPLDLLYLQDSR